MCYKFVSMNSIGSYNLLIIQKATVKWKQVASLPLYQLEQAEENGGVLSVAGEKGFLNFYYSWLFGTNDVETVESVAAISTDNGNPL